MTPEQAAELRPGDIIEFRGDGCYWLAKLVRLDKGGWVAINNGKHCNGFAISILQYPENFYVVGHSDFKL